MNRYFRPYKKQPKTHYLEDYLAFAGLVGILFVAALIGSLN